MPFLAGGFALTGTWLQVRTEQAERRDTYDTARARDGLASEEMDRVPRWRRGIRAKRLARAAALEALSGDEKREVELHDRRVNAWAALLVGSFFGTVLGAVHLLGHIRDRF